MTRATDALNDALTRLSCNDPRPIRVAHVPATWAMAAELAGCHHIQIAGGEWVCRPHRADAEPCPEQERVYGLLDRVADHGRGGAA